MNWLTRWPMTRVTVSAGTINNFFIFSLVRRVSESAGTYRHFWTGADHV